MGRVRTEKLPKYSSVALSLLERIQFDEFAGENILPSEAQLMKQYAVSRTTVRRALGELEQQNYIHRHHGKGAFVNKARVDQDVYRVYSQGFSRIIRSFGRESSVQQLKKKLVPAGKDGSALRLSPTQLMLEYDRLYLADDVPVFYVKSRIRHTSLPEIEKFDFNFVSLSHVVNQVYGVRVYRCDRLVQSVAAGKEEAQVLAITPGYPVLRLSYTSYIDDGLSFLPFETTLLYARTDVFPFNISYI